MSESKRTMALVAALVLLSAGMGGGVQERAAPSYEVTEIKRKLFREEPAPEVQLEVNANLSAGQLLRTGSRSSATILSPEYGASFLLKAKTRARLASDRPGVLLELERGSLRAIFDKWTGEDSPERIVVTPSAVLAVRGTEYGVEVTKSGTTNVTVFSGEVEVMDINRAWAPVRVKAGQYSTIKRGKSPRAPMPHRTSSSDWDRGYRPGAMNQPGGGDRMNGGGSQGMGSGGSMSGGSSSGGSGSQGGGGARRGGGRG
jgi:uncharacterized membrane protein YgcG